MTGLPEIIIGSGPAGISAAKARLARGARVLMLDGGQDLEPENRAHQDRMASRFSTGWTTADIDSYRAANEAPPPGQVRRFGSDFAQEPLAATCADDPGWFGLRASHAIGGLSNLWGASVLPNRTADMADWPVGAGDLAPHYRAVADFMPIAGDTGFDGMFPALSMEGHDSLPMGPQARRVLDRASPDPGLTLGPARQAVRPGCKSCGLCLHGCPWNLIFSARHVLPDLAGNPAFAHRPGAVVRAVTQQGDSVRVHLDGGETIEGARVLVAAGVLETARIALASDWADRLTLRDSQHGFMPLLTPVAADPAAPRHTLTTLFAELDDPALSPFLIHSQIYAYNEFYGPEMIARYGRLMPGVGPPLFRRLARHMMVAQTFLHSDHSARMHLTGAPDGRLRVTLDPNPETLPLLRRAQKRLARALRPTGVLALVPAAHAGLPGSSFHAGSSLPMGELTDLLGRPDGLDRVHVVDASVLPAIAATTITFTVMANAHRIGMETPV